MEMVPQKDSYTSLPNSLLHLRKQNITRGAGTCLYFLSVDICEIFIQCIHPLLYHNIVCHRELISIDKDA